MHPALSDPLKNQQQTNFKVVKLGKNIIIIHGLNFKKIC